MSKKISIGTRPTGKPLPPAADDWINSRSEAPEIPETRNVAPVPPVAAVREPVEKMKRLTIDIPLSLHRKMKAQCALEGTSIADEIREFLLKKYGKS